MFFLNYALKYTNAYLKTTLLANDLVSYGFANWKNTPTVPPETAC